MSETRKNVLTIIFFGSAWGLVEATLGYGLHLLKFFTLVPLTGMFLFPVGFYFLMRVFKETQNTQTILWTGMVAATLKLFDLFIPFHAVHLVITPAIAILLESMAVFVLYRSFAPTTLPRKLITATITSAGWRIGFLGALFFLPFGVVTLLDSGITGITQFLILESLVNGLFIGLLMQLDRREYSLSAKIIAHPILSYTFFGLAAGTQLAFTLLR